MVFVDFLNFYAISRKMLNCVFSNHLVLLFFLSFEIWNFALTYGNFGLPKRTLLIFSILGIFRYFDDTFLFSFDIFFWIFSADLRSLWISFNFVDFECSELFLNLLILCMTLFSVFAWSVYIDRMQRDVTFFPGKQTSSLFFYFFYFHFHFGYVWNYVLDLCWWQFCNSPDWTCFWMFCVRSDVIWFCKMI